MTRLGTALALIEIARRRRDWRPGTVVTLADRRPWQVVLPRLIRGVWTFGDPRRDEDLPAYLAAIERSRSADSWLAYAAAVLEVAELLLRRNYVLTPDDFDRLLAFRPERDTSAGYARFVEGLGRVLVGGTLESRAARPLASREVQPVGDGMRPPIPEP